jgi:hypothetical protein
LNSVRSVFEFSGPTVPITGPPLHLPTLARIHQLSLSQHSHGRLHFASSPSQKAVAERLGLRRNTADLQMLPVACGTTGRTSASSHCNTFEHAPGHLEFRKKLSHCIVRKSERQAALLRATDRQSLQCEFRIVRQKNVSEQRIPDCKKTSACTVLRDQRSNKGK